MKKVIFKGWNCNVLKEKYQSNGRIALQLEDAETGEPVATASVNCVDYDMSESMEKDHTFIKDYSENSGILEALTKAGIVERTGLAWMAGYEMVYLVKVLI